MKEESFKESLSLVREEIKEGKNFEIKQIQIELLEVKEQKEGVVRENDDFKWRLEENESKFDELRESLKQITESSDQSIA